MGGGSVLHDFRTDVLLRSLARSLAAADPRQPLGLSVGRWGRHPVQCGYPGGQLGDRAAPIGPLRPVTDQCYSC